MNEKTPFRTAGFPLSRRVGALLVATVLAVGLFAAFAPLPAVAAGCSVVKHEEDEDRSDGSVWRRVWRELKCNIPQISASNPGYVLKNGREVANPTKSSFTVVLSTGDWSVINEAGLVYFADSFEVSDTDWKLLLHPLPSPTTTAPPTTTTTTTTPKKSDPAPKNPKPPPNQGTQPPSGSSSKPTNPGSGSASAPEQPADEVADPEVTEEPAVETAPRATPSYCLDSTIYIPAYVRVHLCPATVTSAAEDADPLTETSETATAAAPATQAVCVDVSFYRPTHLRPVLCLTLGEGPLGVDFHLIGGETPLLHLPFATPRPT